MRRNSSICLRQRCGLLAAKATICLQHSGICWQRVLAGRRTTLLHVGVGLCAGRPLSMACAFLYVRKANVLTWGCFVALYVCRLREYVKEHASSMAATGMSIGEAGVLGLLGRWRPHSSMHGCLVS